MSPRATSSEYADKTPAVSKSRSVVGGAEASSLRHINTNIDDIDPGKDVSNQADVDSLGGDPVESWICVGAVSGEEEAPGTI